MPELFGHYIFADYVSGNIWAIHHDGATTTPLQYLTSDGGIAGFGVDPRTGEILMADRSDDTIKRLTPLSALLTTLVPANSVWKYLDDGSNQQTAATQPSCTSCALDSDPRNENQSQRAS